MADISKITLPSGSTYNIKDSTARQDISDIKENLASGVHYQGVTTTPLTDGATTPTTISISKDGTATDYAVKQGDQVSYNNVMYAWNGTQWDQLGSAGPIKSLAYKDSVTGSVTPTGTVTQPSFTGLNKSISVTGTPAGTVSAPAFTGTKGTINVSGTPKGSVDITAAAPASGETANYTPTGDVNVTPNTTTVQQITDVGSLPSFSATVADETLTLGFSQGTLPTRASTTVATGVKSATFTGSGTVIKGSFTGQPSSASGSYTPAGSIGAPTFTGTAMTATGDYTPEGTVSKPSFTGNSTTITSK
ncbi:MAG: hypothetical protein PUF17_10425 [Lactimicrobium massiliense]|nr:hypothetical protein [Lactimicrobium massiliense]MDD6561360.1 hypothetical protein [Lactimicrobium massiliense]